MKQLEVFDSTIVPGFRNIQKFSITARTQAMTFSIDTTLEKITIKSSDIADTVVELLIILAAERYGNFQNGIFDTPSFIERENFKNFDYFRIDLDSYQSS